MHKLRQSSLQGMQTMQKPKQMHVQEMSKSLFCQSKVPKMHKRIQV